MVACACPSASSTADVKPYPMASVHVACRKHEDDHRWWESEKAGRDLGEECVYHWVQFHWNGYLRHRWVEHLQGACFWIELSHCDFGLLQREFHDSKPLLDEILNQLKSGKENLNVIWWAYAQGLDIESVDRILLALNVNGSRLAHRFDAPDERMAG